jgi:competence protein ComEC
MEVVARSWRSAPALAPAIAVATGAWLAPRLELSILGLIGLAGLALAAPRPWRLAVWLSAGALAASLHGDRRLTRPFDPGRPVEAVVAVTEHPLRGAFGWSAAGRVEVGRQGREVEPRAGEVILELPQERPAEVGERLRLRGYLARTAGYANRAPTEPGPPRFRVKTSRLIEAEAPAGPVARISHRLRQRVERSLSAAGPGAGVAFTRAWILGDVSALQPPWRRAMRRAGLSHLLAVSGFNVSLAAGFCWLLGGWLPGRWRYLPPLCAIVAYLLLVGPLAPMLRAALMALLGLAALWLRRPPQTANALAVAVGGLVLIDPALVHDVAFQLTVSATAGLVFLAPALEESWQRLPPLWRRPLAASVAAQLATLPFALEAFHQVAPMGLWTNLWAVPWSALCLLVAVAWCCLAAVSPAGAVAAVPVLDCLARPFTALAETPAGLWRVQSSAGGAAIGLGVALALAVACLRPRRAIWVAAALAMGLRCSTGGAAAPRLALLDVGQGDAILLRDEGHAVLIDGGGWSQGDFGGRVLLPALAGEGVHRLDAMVLTHPDRDHCGGLLDLIDYLEVDELWVAPRQPAGCATDLLQRPGPSLRVFWEGEERQVGRWRFHALGPDPAGQGSDNGRSLALVAEVNGGRALLTGDLEADAERRLLASGERLAADLLKVGHHGSQTSTSQPFLGRVQPRLAIVSVGAGNPFGHPNAVVMERLRAARVPTLRTDLAGEIEVAFLPGGRLRVDTPGAPR